MKQAVIFDLDGTLWDSSDNVIKSWNEVLARYPQYNLQVTKEDMYSYMGKTLQDIAALMLPSASKEEQMRIIGECCDNENEFLRKNGGKLYPDLETTLQKLCKDYELYIVSNCQSGYIETFLAYHKLEKYISDTECQGNTGRDKWENIRLIIERNRVDKAVYVGDTKLDMESAHKAGAQYIRAAYGFGRFECKDPELYNISDLPQLIMDVMPPKNGSEIRSDM